MRVKLRKPSVRRFKLRKFISQSLIESVCDPFLTSCLLILNKHNCFKCISSIPLVNIQHFPTISVRVSLSQNLFYPQTSPIMWLTICQRQTFIACPPGCMLNVQWVWGFISVTSCMLSSITHSLFTRCHLLWDIMKSYVQWVSCPLSCSPFQLVPSTILPSQFIMEDEQSSDPYT